MVFSAFPPDRVRIGSLEHVLPIALALAFSVWLIVHSKKRLQRRYQHAIFHALGCAVSAVVLLFHLYRIGLGNYSLKTDLPLYLCSLIALLIPLFTYSRRYWMYQVLLFWIVAGTLQGTLDSGHRPRISHLRLFPVLGRAFGTFGHYFLCHLRAWDASNV